MYCYTRKRASNTTSTRRETRVAVHMQERKKASDNKTTKYRTKFKMKDRVKVGYRERDGRRESMKRERRMHGGGGACYPSP